MDLSLYSQICLTILLISSSLFCLFIVLDKITWYDGKLKLSLVFSKYKWVMLFFVTLSILAILLGLIWGWL